MVRQRASRPSRPRLVTGRPAETPILDLGEGVRVYFELLNQIRALDSIRDDIRGRILRAMDRDDVEQFQVDGIQAIRQVRRFPAQIDEKRAERILQSEGRLKEAERTVLDPEKAREILDDLYVQGRIRKDELPYTEPREVEALIVQTIPPGR